MLVIRSASDIIVLESYGRRRKKSIIGGKNEMKNWENAEIVSLSINETASGTLHTGTEKDWGGLHGTGTHDHEHCSEGYSDSGFEGFVAHIIDVFLPSCTGVSSSSGASSNGGNSSGDVTGDIS